MSVFVYDVNGLVETRPDTDHKVVGKEVFAHNKANPGAPRKILVGAEFPPASYTFDGALGDIRPKTKTELVADGEMQLPGDYVIASGAKGEQILSPFHKLNAAGDVVEKTMQEKVDDGVVAMDTQTQKIVDDQIVLKTNQELLDDAVITLADMKQKTVDRLRLEVEHHFNATKTTNGYSLDMLARQKASFTYPYRNVADTDPDKAQLLADKIIYPNAIVDEILDAVKVVQTAYSNAVTAAKDAETNTQPASVFEAITLSGYLP